MVARCAKNQQNPILIRHFPYVTLNSELLGGDMDLDFGLCGYCCAIFNVWFVWGESEYSNREINLLVLGGLYVN